MKSSLLPLKHISNLLTVNNSSTEQQLRSFLLGVAAFFFIGSILELYLLEHYMELRQWIPILLSAAGFVMCTWAWRSPGRSLLISLRGLMALVAVASLYVIYLHFMGNFQFTKEINPSFTTLEALWPAIKGSNPLLAPGMLLAAALLAAGGTYRHPSLDS